MIMEKALVGVDRKQRENGDQLQALAQHVFHRNAVGIVVVGIERQHAARQRVHPVFARRFEDHIAHKGGRQRAIPGEKGGKGGKLLPLRQLGKKEEPDRLLKAKPPLGEKAAAEIPDRDPAVKELSLAGEKTAFSVAFFGDDGGDLRQPGHHAVAVVVAQAALDLMEGIHLRGDPVSVERELRQTADLRRDLGIQSFHNAPFSLRPAGRGSLRR